MNPTQTATAADKTQEVLVNVVLDRSGSMQSTQKNTISGYNEYINGLRADKDTKYSVSLIQFDAPHEGPELTVTYADKPLSEVADLDAKNYEPRGMTPLYDAVGECIRRVEAKDRAVLTVPKVTRRRFTQRWQRLRCVTRVLRHSTVADRCRPALLLPRLAPKGQRCSAPREVGLLRRLRFPRAQPTAPPASLQSPQERSGVFAVKYLSPEQVASTLGVSRRTVYNWVRSGKLPAKQTGRTWRIKEQDLG